MDPREVFIEVMERGSFTEAADRLGISLSYASRRVRALEEQLGITLLARSTRRVAPTPEGQRYYEQLAPLWRGLAELDAITGSRAIEPNGDLRVALPLTFGLKRLQPLLDSFMERWPQVTVEASFSDRMGDLLDADVTIRGGLLEDRALVARKLTDFHGVLAASPSYLERNPPIEAPSDLSEHDAVMYTLRRSFGARWTVGGEVVQPRARFRADSGDALVQAAVAGLGVVYQPDFLVDDAIAEGTLVPVLAGIETFTGAFWAIRSRPVPTVTVDALIEHLVQGLAS